MSFYFLITTHTFPRKRTRHKTVEINVFFNKSLREVEQAPLPDTKFNKVLKISKGQPVRMFQLKEMNHHIGPGLNAY